MQNGANAKWKIQLSVTGDTAAVATDTLAQLIEAFKDSFRPWQTTTSSAHPSCVKLQREAVYKHLSQGTNAFALAQVLPQNQSYI